ncbi:MAG: YihY/virulence factor BrkB family protein [Novosphingobium sp.]
MDHRPESSPPSVSDISARSWPLHDYSPEARRREAIHARQAQVQRLGFRGAVREAFAPGARLRAVLVRVAVGTWNDGFIHAGNLAYMAILAIFPFFILGAAMLSLFGGGWDPDEIVRTIITAMPPVVGNVIAPVAKNVIAARTGWLLWAGAAVGLWTVSSLIETLRDILRRAYGTERTLGFWHHRLSSVALIVGAVTLLIASFIVQVLIGTAEELIDAQMPQLAPLLEHLSISRILPALALFGSIYTLFYTLTPAGYRAPSYPKWPGAVLVTAWWMGVSFGLPPLLRTIFAYNLTYGSLAGVMISLFFFWLVGLGMVIGAELNAALAVSPEEHEMHERIEAGTEQMRNQGGASE